jgi:hypothetical protein
MRVGGNGDGLKIVRPGKVVGFFRSCAGSQDQLRKIRPGNFSWDGKWQAGDKTRTETAGCCAIWRCLSRVDNDNTEPLTEHTRSTIRGQGLVFTGYLGPV